MAINLSSPILSDPNKMIRWFGSALLTLVVACNLTGCMTLDGIKDHSLFGKKKGPPCGKVAQIAVTWESQVLFAPDPVKNGQPSPVLAGRIYLFSPEYVPVKAEGTVSVQLFVPGSQEPMEQWNMDAKLLENVVSRDTIGWGYNLPLPWATYHPGLRDVELSVCYTTKEGIPLYSRSTLKLEHGEREFRVSQRVQTGDGKIIEKK